jgi:hypothetical protein
MHTHPTVHVSQNGREADIDVDMAPLIRELWRAGIDIQYCCQELGESLDNSAQGLSSIEFGTAPKLASFLDHVVDGGPPNGEVYIDAAFGGWITEVRLWDNASLDVWDDASTKLRVPARFEADSFEVHFPRRQIREITERVAAFTTRGSIPPPPSTGKNGHP